MQTFCNIYFDTRVADERIKNEFNTICVDVPKWIELGWVTCSEAHRTNIYDKRVYRIKITDTGLKVLEFNEL